MLTSPPAAPWLEALAAAPSKTFSGTKRAAFVAASWHDASIEVATGPSNASVALLVHKTAPKWSSSPQNNSEPQTAKDQTAAGCALSKLATRARGTL